MNRITDFETMYELDVGRPMPREIGTPQYMAPEVFAKGNSCTKAADAYSFGVTCAEIWNQQRPYPLEIRPEQLRDMVVDGMVCQ